MFEGFIAGKLAGKAFKEDVFKSIKRHAALGAIIMMFPDFGLGTIIFAFILWDMYKSVAEKCSINFSEHKGELIVTGLIINIVVAFVIDTTLTAFPFIEPFLIYFQFYLSGKLFVERLEKLPVEKQNLLVGYDAAADRRLLELSTSEVAQSASEHVKCPGCGEEVLEDWVFCESCGFKLKDGIRSELCVDAIETTTPDELTYSSVAKKHQPRIRFSM